MADPRRHLKNPTNLAFETSCVNSTAELIHAMQDAAVEIKYRTFRGHVNGIVLDLWARVMGYGHPMDRTTLLLCNDWHVSYWKSVYDGRPCVYVDHSRIEYIWVQPHPPEPPSEEMLAFIKETERKCLVAMGIPKDFLKSREAANA